ncbi:MAG: hypothetical protein HUJ74_02125 [Lachnospiraceae bacterium]|nr:hypothetical protein [Lachnospiraceae bacterium]
MIKICQELYLSLERIYADNRSVEILGEILSEDRALILVAKCGLSHGLSQLYLLSEADSFHIRIQL